MPDPPKNIKLSAKEIVNSLPTISYKDYLNYKPEPKKNFPVNLNLHSTGNLRDTSVSGRLDIPLSERLNLNLNAGKNNYRAGLSYKFDKGGHLHPHGEGPEAKWNRERQEKFQAETEALTKLEREQAQELQDAKTQYEADKISYAEYQAEATRRRKILETERTRVQNVRDNVLNTAADLDIKKQQIFNVPYSDQTDIQREAEAYYYNILSPSYNEDGSLKTKADQKEAIKNMPQALKDVLPNEGLYDLFMYNKFDEDGNLINRQNPGQPITDATDQDQVKYRSNRGLYCTPGSTDCYRRAGADDMPVLSGNLGFYNKAEAGTIPFQQIADTEAELGDMALLKGVAPQDYAVSNSPDVERVHHTTVVSDLGPLEDGQINEMYAYSPRGGSREAFSSDPYYVDPNSTWGDKDILFYRYVGNTPQLEKNVRPENLAKDYPVTEMPTFDKTDYQHYNRMPSRGAAYIGKPDAQLAAEQNRMVEQMNSFDPTANMNKRELRKYNKFKDQSNFPSLAYNYNSEGYAYGGAFPTEPPTEPDEVPIEVPGTKQDFINSIRNFKLRNVSGPMMSKNVAIGLQALSNYGFNPENTTTITSLLRGSGTNAGVGGVRNSRHLSGNAMDISSKEDSKEFIDWTHTPEGEKWLKDFNINRLDERDKPDASHWHFGFNDPENTENIANYKFYNQVYDKYKNPEGYMDFDKYMNMPQLEPGDFDPVQVEPRPIAKIDNLGPSPTLQELPTNTTTEAYNNLLASRDKLRNFPTIDSTRLTSNRRGGTMKFHYGGSYHRHPHMNIPLDHDGASTLQDKFANEKQNFTNYLNHPFYQQNAQTAWGDDAALNIQNQLDRINNTNIGYDNWKNNMHGSVGLYGAPDEEGKPGQITMRDDLPLSGELHTIGHEVGHSSDLSPENIEGSAYKKKMYPEFSKYEDLNIDFDVSSLPTGYVGGKKLDPQATAEYLNIPTEFRTRLNHVKSLMADDDFNWNEKSGEEISEWIQNAQRGHKSSNKMWLDEYALDEVKDISGYNRIEDIRYSDNFGDKYKNYADKDWRKEQAKKGNKHYQKAWKKGIRTPEQWWDKFQTSWDDEPEMKKQFFEDKDGDGVPDMQYQMDPSNFPKKQDTKFLEYVFKELAQNPTKDMKRTNKAKYGGKAYPAPPYYPYHSANLRVDKNYDKTHVQPSVFAYGGTTEPYYYGATSKYSPTGTQNRQYSHGGPHSPYPDVDVMDFDTEQRNIINERLVEANKAQMSAYEGYDVGDWERNMAALAVNTVPRSRWTGSAIDTPGTKGTYPSAVDNPSYTTSTNYTNTGNIVNQNDPIITRDNNVLLGEHYDNRLGDVDVMDNPLYSYNYSEMQGRDDAGSLTGDNYYAPNISLNKAPTQPTYSELTTGIKQVPMLNPDYTLQANKRRSNVKRNPNKSNYMKNISSRKTQEALKNKYLYSNPKYDVNNPAEGVNQYVTYGDLRGKARRQAIPATEDETTYFKNNELVSQRQYEAAQKYNQGKYDKYVQNVDNWNKQVTGTKDFFKFVDKRGGKLKHGGTHPTWQDKKNAENRAAWEQKTKDYWAGQDKYQQDVEGYKGYTTAQDALAAEQERTSQARAKAVELGKKAYYDPDYQEQILNYYIKPGEWNNYNPFYCATRSCELERAAGYTMPGTEDPVKIISGTHSWKGKSEDMGYQKIDPRNIKAGDRILYGGNDPFHSLIYAGTSGDDHMVLNDHGSGSSWDYNPSPDINSVLGGDPMDDTNRYNAYRYVGNTPQLQQNVDAYGNMVQPVAPTGGMPSLPMKFINTNVPERQIQNVPAPNYDHLLNKRGKMKRKFRKRGGPGDPPTQKEFDALTQAEKEAVVKQYPGRYNISADFRSPGVEVAPSQIEFDNMDQKTKEIMLLRYPERYKISSDIPSAEDLQNFQVGPGGYGTMGEYNMSDAETRAKWDAWAKGTQTYPHPTQIGDYAKGGYMGINPDHKGYCTPMSKATCTPPRKALARRLKPGGDLYRGNKEKGGYMNYLANGGPVNPYDTSGYYSGYDSLDSIGNTPTQPGGMPNLTGTDFFNTGDPALGGSGTTGTNTGGNNMGQYANYAMTAANIGTDIANTENYWENEAAMNQNADQIISMIPGYGPFHGLATAGANAVTPEATATNYDEHGNVEGQKFDSTFDKQANVLLKPSHEYMTENIADKDWGGLASSILKLPNSNQNQALLSSGKTIGNMGGKEQTGSARNTVPGFEEQTSGGGQNLNYLDTNIPQQAKRGGYQRYFQNGGEIPQLAEFNGGYTHDDASVGNMNQGIPVGPNGTVEKNETMADSKDGSKFIFTDTTTMTKDIANEFGYPKRFVGKTYADISKSLKPGGWAKRIDDTEDNNTMKLETDRLIGAWEKQEEDEFNKKMATMAEEHPQKFEQMMQAQQQAEQMMQQQQMQQGPSPEEQAMMAQQQGAPQGMPPQGMVPQGMPMGKMGGHRGSSCGCHEMGGYMDYLQGEKGLGGTGTKAVGNVLEQGSSFLNLIPGVGNILAPVVGGIGGALTSEEGSSVGEVLKNVGFGAAGSIPGVGQFTGVGEQLLDKGLDIADVETASEKHREEQWETNPDRQRKLEEGDAKVNQVLGAVNQAVSLGSDISKGIKGAQETNFAKGDKDLAGWAPKGTTSGVDPITGDAMSFAPGYTPPVSEGFDMSATSSLPSIDANMKRGGRLYQTGGPLTESDPTKWTEEERKAFQEWANLEAGSDITKIEGGDYGWGKASKKAWEDYKDKYVAKVKSDAETAAYLQQSRIDEGLYDINPQTNIYDIPAYSDDMLKSMIQTDLGEDPGIVTEGTLGNEENIVPGPYNIKDYYWENPLEEKDDDGVDTGVTDEGYKQHEGYEHKRTTGEKLAAAGTPLWNIGQGIYGMTQTPDKLGRIDPIQAERVDYSEAVKRAQEAAAGQRMSLRNAGTAGYIPRMQKSYIDTMNYIGGVEQQEDNKNAEARMRANIANAGIAGKNLEMKKYEQAYKDKAKAANAAMIGEGLSQLDRLRQEGEMNRMVAQGLYPMIAPDYADYYSYGRGKNKGTGTG